MKTHRPRPPQKPKSDLLELDETSQSIYTAANHVAGLEVWLSRERVSLGDEPEKNPKYSVLVAKREAVRAARTALDQLVSVWVEEPAAFVMEDAMGYMEDFYLNMGNEHFRDGKLTLEAMSWSALWHSNVRRFYARGIQRRFDVPRSPKPYAVLFTQRREEWQARIPDLGERVIGHGATLWEAWSACESAWIGERPTLTRMPAARVKRLMDVPKTYLADAVFAKLQTLFVEAIEHPQNP